MTDTSRAEFEAWSAKNEAAPYENTTEAMFAAWQAARVQPIGHKSDLIARLRSSIRYAESYEFVAVSTANIRAAIALLSARPADPITDANQIVHIQFGALSDEEIATMGYVEFGIVADDSEIAAFAHAILAAHGMISQSTDAGNVSKNAVEIGRSTCDGCNGNGEIGGLRQDGYHSEPCPFCGGSGTYQHPPAPANLPPSLPPGLPPITQPLIAEAARDDGASHVPVGYKSLYAAATCTYCGLSQNDVNRDDVAGDAS